MNDNTALFFLFIGIGLYLIYHFSKPSGSYGEDTPVGPGTYRIGEDLSPGKCDWRRATPPHPAVIEI